MRSCVYPGKKNTLKHAKRTEYKQRGDERDRMCVYAFGKEKECVLERARILSQERERERIKKKNMLSHSNSARITCLYQ